VTGESWSVGGVQKGAASVGRQLELGQYDEMSVNNPRHSDERDFRERARGIKAIVIVCLITAAMLA
jgi:hypothetical protein